MASIADNLQAVKSRLGTVTLLAVSKGQDVEKIRAAVAAGQRAFGENYAQEALQRMDQVHGLEWHLIGPLQSNKTRAVAERFDWVQTVASEKIAKRLSEQRPAGLPPLNVLIQVNASGEATKSGVRPEEVPELAQRIVAMENLRLRGVMAIPEPGADRSRYAQMKKIFDSLKPLGVDTLSMGMSDDMDVAISEGSTMVRIGTAIFGSRQRKAA
jgi:pyridoxal phosphate enzyme (YggS family)